MIEFEMTVEIHSALHELQHLHVQLQSETFLLQKVRNNSVRASAVRIEDISVEIGGLLHRLANIQREEMVAESILRNNLKLLWVDDQVESFDQVISAVSQFNIEIVPAKSGQEAMEYILDHPVDGALVDLKMPGSVSGLDFVKYTIGQIPCVIVSGYIGATELQRAAIESGAVGVLEKSPDMTSNHMQLAGKIIGFFAEERRIKALESEVTANRSSLKLSVDSVLQSLDQLPDETKAEMAPFLEIIAKELDSENPDIEKISHAGTAAGNVAQGAAGNLAAQGILHLLAIFF